MRKKNSHSGPLKGGASRGRRARKSRAIETRRGFLRASGAGIVGLTLNNLSSARAADGDPTDLTITYVDGVGSGPDQLWINGTLDNSFPEPLESGDVISCIPAGGTDSVVDAFKIESSDPEANPTEPEITYQGNGDSLDVDLSVLDGFEENYDPNVGNSQNDEPYQITDNDGDSIGING